MFFPSVSSQRLVCAWQNIVLDSDSLAVAFLAQGVILHHLPEDLSDLENLNDFQSGGPFQRSLYTLDPLGS